jgi:hypothetical protein
MTKDEALDLALDWLVCYKDKSMSRNNAEELAEELITAIKQARSAPVQELTNIERHEQNVQKFLAAQPAPVQEPVAFEDWHSANYVQPLEKYGDSYKNMHVRNRWQGWLGAKSTPPAAQRQWVGLTDVEIDLFINGRGDEHDDDYVEPTGDGFGLTDADLVELVRRAEAKLKERNT